MIFQERPTSRSLFFFKDCIASCNENKSNVVEPEAQYCCIPEKLNLKSAKTVKPYVTSAWIWGGLADEMG
jgi:hypothetical protein